MKTRFNLNLMLLASMLMMLSTSCGSKKSTSASKTSANVIEAKPGLKLTYEVDFFGTVYDFVVTLKENSETRLSFDYVMTNANNTSGTVNIAAEAMKNATEQFNFFRGGTENLTNQTSVWVSSRVFSQLASDAGVATISPDGGRSSVKIDAKSKTTDFAVLNKSTNKVINLANIYAQSADGNTKYWILNSAAAPIILKMDLGWKIALKSFEY